jgi:lysyl-tRNA synthetase class 2
VVSTIAKELTGSTIVPYQGQQIDLTPPWRRVPMHTLVKEKCGVEFLDYMTTGDTEGEY